VVLLRRTLVGLLKDHAVAASHHDATLNNAASSYTTSVDSTVASRSHSMVGETDRWTAEQLTLMPRFGGGSCSVVVRCCYSACK
jgi:hypothetical protein